VVAVQFQGREELLREQIASYRALTAEYDTGFTRAATCRMTCLWPTMCAQPTPAAAVGDGAGRRRGVGDVVDLRGRDG
jgi:hypothetical protein